MRSPTYRIEVNTESIIYSFSNEPLHHQQQLSTPTTPPIFTTQISQISQQYELINAPGTLPVAYYRSSSSGSAANMFGGANSSSNANATAAAAAAVPSAAVSVGGKRCEIIKPVYETSASESCYSLSWNPHVETSLLAGLIGKLKIFDTRGCISHQKANIPSIVYFVFAITRTTTTTKSQVKRRLEFEQREHQVCVRLQHRRGTKRLAVPRSLVQREHRRSLGHSHVQQAAAANGRERAHRQNAMVSDQVSGNLFCFLFCFCCRKLSCCVLQKCGQDLRVDQELEGARHILNNGRQQREQVVDRHEWRRQRRREERPPI